VRPRAWHQRRRPLLAPGRVAPPRPFLARIHLPCPSLNTPELHLAENSRSAHRNRGWDGLRSAVPPFSIAGASSDLRTASNGTLGEPTPLTHPFPAKLGLPLAGFRRSPSLAATRGDIARSEIFSGAKTQNPGTCL
jgi:hypothetical protein